MIFERRKRSSTTPSQQQASSALPCIGTIDKSIPLLRTILIIAGVAGAALNIGRVADHLFAAGLLLHFTIWFEAWWRVTRVH